MIGGWNACATLWPGIAAVRILDTGKQEADYICGGVMIMRKTHPELPRPFRTPLVPFLPIVGVIVNLLLMAGLGWENWTRLFVWMAIGMAVYFGYSRHHSRLNLPLVEARK